MIIRKISWLFLLVWQLLVMGLKIGYPTPLEQENGVTSPTLLLGSRVDWYVQQEKNNSGITAVQYNNTESKLVLTCNLDANHPPLSQGEVLLDLRYLTGLEAHVPVDMTGRWIEVQLEVPPAFIGPLSQPPSCQIFLKDHHFNSFYSAPAFWQQPGILKVVWQVWPDSTTQGYQSPGFEARRIRFIGIKVALSPDSEQQYRGSLKIRSITVSPALPAIAPPELPPTMPFPYITAGCDVEKQGDGFYIDGYRWFAIGGNWRMLEYRQNFGATAWFPGGNGVSKHLGFLATRMEWFRSAGITLLRIGLLDDGATMFDRSGFVIGYNAIFKEDVSAFLTLANQYQIKVEFLLLDCLVAARGQQVGPVFIQGRRQIIENPVLRQHYIENFLTPFLNEFGNDPAIFGFDIINEPEWFITRKEGGGWVQKAPGQNTYDAPISLRDFREFIRLCSDTIHAITPGKWVTVGVSCTKRRILDNLDLDYHAMHYYPPMGDLLWNMSQHYLNRPWGLQEFPANGDLFSYYLTVYEHRGAGAQVWNLSPAIDEYAYSFAEEAGKLQEIRRFADYLDQLPMSLSVDKNQLFFMATSEYPTPGEQVFFINQSGRGLLEWRIHSSVPWLACTPSSGTGPAIIAVTAKANNLAPGIYRGIILISATHTVECNRTIRVNLHVKAPDILKKSGAIRLL